MNSSKIKIAFVTTVYKNQVVGPARFANLVHHFYDMKEDVELHIIKTDDSQGKNFHNIEIQANFFQNQKGLLHYSKVLGKKLIELDKELFFDKIVFNDALLGYFFLKHAETKAEIISLVNDEDKVNYAVGLTPRSIKYKILKRYQARASQLADKVLVNSHYLKSIVLEHYNVEESKLHMMYVGIDINRNAYREHQLSFNERIKVLFVKNNYIRGGLFDLIEALNRLNHLTFELIIAGPESDIEVLFYGKAHSHVKLRFLGHTSPDEVLDLMYSSHLFCVPARSEALGIANMEAMACGLPVIATNVGGIPEVTNHGENAWVAEAMNPNSLKNMIQSCISDEKTRKQKSLAARKYIEEHFNHDKMLHTFHDILMQ